MDRPEDHLFNFQVDGAALKLLVKGMRHYLEKWPGGEPHDQVACLLYTSPSPRDRG